MRTILFVLLTAAPVAAGLFGQSPAPTPSPPVETRQFDFWIGEWEVTTANGKIAGTNTIERIANGRGLLEHWTGAAGGTGKSLNSYNAAKRQWQQFWVGGDGTVLELAGGLDALGHMVLTGESGPARPMLNRITWTPNPDGTVRQHWEQSTDGGITWTTLFEGLYRRTKELAEPSQQ